MSNDPKTIKIIITEPTIVLGSHVDRFSTHELEQGEALVVCSAGRAVRFEQASDDLRAAAEAYAKGPTEQAAAAPEVESAAAAPETESASAAPTSGRKKGRNAAPAAE